MVLKDINDRELVVIGGIAVVVWLVLRHWHNHGGHFPHVQNGYQYTG